MAVPFVTGHIVADDTAMLIDWTPCLAAHYDFPSWLLISGLIVLHLQLSVFQMVWFPGKPTNSLQSTPLSHPSLFSARMLCRGCWISINRPILYSSGSVSHGIYTTPLKPRFWLRHTLNENRIHETLVATGSFNKKVCSNAVWWAWDLSSVHGLFLFC